MVFTPLHYVPSAAAALLTIILAFSAIKPMHRHLGTAMAIMGVLGLLGYISAGNIRLYPLDFHAMHAGIGLAALLTSLSLFMDRLLFHKISQGLHCHLGYAAALLAVAALLMGFVMLSGQVFQNQEIVLAVQEPASSHLPEIEVSDYRGVKLTPLSLQRNNAIMGTQHINRTTYRLKVVGLVEKNLSLSYEDLLRLPAYSETAYMPCVEGWGFYAKWTGFRVSDLLNLSVYKPQARYAVFRTAEGYSTSLPLDYLREDRILMAYGINDMTLPPERGFPLQLVARGRYGYKWAKWITEIEVTDKESRGYWESRGYSNRARVGELPFG